MSAESANCTHGRARRRYVNVLHSDKGPPRGHDEVSNGPRQWLSQTRILDRPLSLSDTESEDSTPDFNPSTLASSLVAANLLLDSLDAVLEAEDLSGLKNLQSARLWACSSRFVFVSLLGIRILGALRPCLR